MSKAERTRERIERTALSLFAEKGVDQTTTRDIAEGAGIAEGTIYRHFAGKDALVRHIFVSRYLGLAEELAALRAGEATLAGRIAAMVGRFCALFDRDPALFRFLFFVQHGQLSAVPAGAPTPVDEIRATLAEAMVRGEIPAGDPDLATAMVFGVVTQPAVFRIYGRIRPTLGARAPEIAAACLRLLGAAAETRKDRT